MASKIAAALSSSWLTFMEWDPDTLELTLTMRGEPFTHYSVPQDVAMGLQNASSPGQYWHAVIKGSF